MRYLKIALKALVALILIALAVALFYWKNQSSSYKGNLKLKRFKISSRNVL